jgi:hypothetical protein
MIPMYPWLKNRLSIRKSLTKKLSLKLPQTSNYGETQNKKICCLFFRHTVPEIKSIL